MATSCELNLDGTPVAGLCASPVRVVARAKDFALGHSSDSSRVAALVAEGDRFDLNERISLSAAAGTAGTFDRLGLTILTLDLTVDVQAYSDAKKIPDDNRFWTFRYSLAGCLGDVLVCQRSSASDLCRDENFQFIDAATGELSYMRPVNALALGGAGTCAAEGAGLRVQAKLKNEVTLGKGVTALEVDFDRGNRVFAPTSVLPSHPSASVLLQNAAKILPDWLYIAKHQTSKGGDSDLTATLTVEKPIE